jgi:adenosylmethionine-8-amino-7-oxononanoate aminotransferase
MLFFLLHKVIKSASFPIKYSTKGLKNHKRCNFCGKSVGWTAIACIFVEILVFMSYNTSQLLNDDLKHVWHPFTQMQTAPQHLPIVRAKDASLFTASGERYLDCNSSWWVCTHGHGNAYLKQALVAQFDDIDHVIFAGVTHPKAVELAKRVSGILPDQLTKVFFSDDGSTAVEVALKMSFQYWHNKGIDKKRILALDGAYHGDTFGAMSISQRGYFNAPFEHLFFDVDYLDFPTEELEDTCLKQAEEFFKTGEFAALIVEPLVQGSAGMRMYRPEFLEALSSLAKEHGVLLIFDEIMTGWGRTGKLFAHNYIKTVPDIVCLSKGLTAGVMPLGLTVATEEIYEAFLAPEKTKALLHGHSYTGNPLACALACANLDLVEKPDFQQAIDRISKKHEGFIAELKNRFPQHTYRFLGTIAVVEIVEGENATYFSSLRDRAYDYFLSKFLLIRPLGNVVFLNPPYCTTDEELDEMYAGITGFLEELAN